MRIAAIDLNIIRAHCSESATGEPRDTEIGHAWFGGGRLEKYLLRQLVGRLPYLMSGFEAESGERFPGLG